MEALLKILTNLHPEVDFETSTDLSLIHISEPTRPY